MAGRKPYHQGATRATFDPTARESLPPSKPLELEADSMRGTSDDLVQLITSLDSHTYPRYKDIRGFWRYKYGILQVLHIQPDPFAPPSRFKLYVSHDVAGFPVYLRSNSSRSAALCDYLARRLFAVASSCSDTKGPWSERSSAIVFDEPGQQILQRTSVTLSDTGIEVRFGLNLPARGRTILGNDAARVFSYGIASLFATLLSSSHDEKQLRDFTDCCEDQDDLRKQIALAGLSAFVRNGAHLPRASGASDEPMFGKDVVFFQSPANLERTFHLPHRGTISGMGIPTGVTMIAGGGFHGKSTLLDALSVGCYNHIPGDGREFVVTSSKTVSIEGEDGRAVTNVDISPFINNLPGGITTTSFSTQDASGSTSMAAGVTEALELGADTLLFDEDTCATNFLIRDIRMRRLITADPITPLVLKVRALHHDYKCSSILVIGGCGDYCDVVDLVLEMRQYQCYDITEKARQISREYPSGVEQFQERHFGAVRPRMLSLTSLPSQDVKVIARPHKVIDVGGSALDLSGLPQLVNTSQTRAIVSAMRVLAANLQTGSLAEVLQQLDAVLDREGLTTLIQHDQSDYLLARPRSLEIGMAINRLRSVWLQYENTIKMEM